MFLKRMLKLAKNVAALKGICRNCWVLADLIKCKRGIFHLASRLCEAASDYLVKWMVYMWKNLQLESNLLCFVTYVFN